MLCYHLIIQDCESYAFREAPAEYPNARHERFLQALVPDMSGASRPGLRRCPACGELLSKRDEAITGLVVRKRRYDISVTYDGVYIVSNLFKSVYDANGLTGLKFISLPHDAAYFPIQITNVVDFDAERCGTRFIKRCPECGHYESVVGVTPVYLKAGALIPKHGFARTDLDFGTADGKGPVLLCGESAGRILKAAKLKGLHLNAVTGDFQSPA